MDGFVGQTRIVRPNYYHRPVAADGEPKRFRQWVGEVIATKGRDELIRHISTWSSDVATALRNGEGEVAFRKLVYDIEPEDGALDQLRQEVFRDSILFQVGTLRVRKCDQLRQQVYRDSLEFHIGKLRIHTMTAKKRQREWMKRAENKWGARWVDCSSPLWVQTGFEYSPYEGSRYPERWEPRGLDIHVTSEGSLGGRDLYGHIGTLNLPAEEDALLASLYAESLKYPS